VQVDVVVDDHLGAMRRPVRAAGLMPFR